MKLLLIAIFTFFLFGCGERTKALSTPKVEKDPKDYTLTESSTAWETDKYCPTCLATTNFKEQMSDICNDCGTYQPYLMLNVDRSFRQIYYGGKWIWQYKYQNKTVLSEKQIHDNNVDE